MDKVTIFWTAFAFAIGYVSIMIAAPPHVYFTWPAMYAGLGNVGLYHIGKFQLPGGLVTAANNAITKLTK